MVRYLLHLTALFGFSVAAVGQSSRNGNPIPVFQAGYLDNNYRIVYLLENETLIAVERINEKETGKEFLQFESAGKNSVATLQMETEGGHWISLKIRNRDLLRKSDKEAAKKEYDELISDKNGKKIILIDTKYTWCNEICHRFTNNTEIETTILGYSEEKGPNGERDYEKGVQIMTGTAPNIPARLNVIPCHSTVFWVSAEHTKKIDQKDLAKLKESKTPNSSALIGMFYFSQNPPAIEEANKYFQIAYELLPEENREIKDGLDLDDETFQILVGRNVFNNKEQLKQSFAQDPLLVIQKLLDIEQGVKESIELRKEKNKANGKDNPVTTRKVVPVPLTNKVGTPPMSTNEVVIRSRRVPVPAQSNSSQPSSKPDQNQSPTNPQQNP